MPSTTLWVYLSGGRGDVKVTEEWDGNPPTEEGHVDLSGAPDDGEGKEAGEPYRDIFPSTLRTPSFTLVSPPGAGPPSTQYGYAGEGADLTVYNSAVTGRLSDEVKHEKPRQFQKICTWIIFTEDTSGAVFKFRKSSVVGWGRFPRV